MQDSAAPDEDAHFCNTLYAASLQEALAWMKRER